jgi:hypothetical protein
VLQIALRSLATWNSTLLSPKSQVVSTLSCSAPTGRRAAVKTASTCKDCPPSFGILLERLADSHGERVTVHALGDVGTKIDMIFLAQRESQPTATAWQEVAILYPL